MKTVNFPSYSVGPNVYDEINSICRRSGKSIVVIGGKTALSKAKDKIEKGLENSELKILDWIWYGGESSVENVAKLRESESVKKADMIFGVGGGKALDTCKVLKKLTKLPLYTFPTIASTCSGITKVAVMYFDNGEFSHVENCPDFPEHCFIDMEIMADAPEKYLLAGMSDAMAKFFESDFSSRGDEFDHTDALGLKIAELCWSDIKKYGAEAYLDRSKKMNSPSMEKVVLTNIITTGLTSILVNGDFYNGGLAHALYNAITGIPEFNTDYLHGEVVAYGVLVLMFMDKDFDYLDELIDLYRKLELPTTYNELGLDENSLEKISTTASKSDSIAHSPYVITAEKIREALLGLDEYLKIIHVKN